MQILKPLAKLRGLFVIFLLSFIAMGNQCEKQDKFFIEVIQGKDTFSVKDSIALLEKKPFTLKVYFYGEEGIFANFSKESNIYYLPKDKKPEGYKHLGSKAMAETYNKDRDVFLTPEYWHYWFYGDRNDDKEWHRLDSGSMVYKEKFVYGERTINQFIAKDSKKNIALADIDSPVFMFFLARKDARESGYPEEYQRERMVINWKD